MRCETCDRPLDRSGQAHYCGHGRAVPDAPAAAFSRASRRVVRFGVVYAAVVVIAGALGLAGYAPVISGATAEVSTPPSILVVGAIYGQVGVVCVAGLLISTVVWIARARRLAVSPGVAGYGGLVLGVLLIASAYVLPRQVPTATGAVAMEVAMRLGAVVVLIAGVLVVRARTRPQTGRHDLAGRPA